MNTLEEKMNKIKTDVENSLHNGQHYSALSLALTIPDVCGYLERPELAKESKKRYVYWLNKYFTEFEDYGDWMKAGDLYALRCAFLHGGSSDLELHKAREVLNKYRFTYSLKNNNFSHKNFSTFIDKKNKTITVLQVDVNEFCQEILDALRLFIHEQKNNKDINSLAANLVTLDNIDNDFYI